MFKVTWMIKQVDHFALETQAIDIAQVHLNSSNVLQVLMSDIFLNNILVRCINRELEVSWCKILWECEVSIFKILQSFQRWTSFWWWWNHTNKIVTATD